jgi:hypothetical protein
MSYIVGTYVAYMAASVLLTIWVASTLYRRGRVFLVDAFHGNEELAESVNHLLVVGFYLINLGFITLALRTGAEIGNLRGAIELLADKLGVVMLVLGGMHFFNLYVFHRIGKRNQETFLPPPVDADMHAAPPRL